MDNLNVVNALIIDIKKTLMVNPLRLEGELMVIRKFGISWAVYLQCYASAVEEAAFELGLTLPFEKEEK